MKLKVLIGAIVLALLIIWPRDVTGQDDTSKLDTALAQEVIHPLGPRWNKDDAQRKWRRGLDRRDEFLKDIGLTDEQMEHIKKLRTQLRKDMETLRKTYHQNFLASLNEEQRKLLEHKRLERNVLRETRAKAADTTIAIRGYVSTTSWGTVKQDTE